MTAGVAMHPNKAMFQHATSQVGAEFLFDEVRNRALSLLPAGEKRLQLFGDNAVQYGLFRLARNILERSVRHAETSSSG